MFVTGTRTPIITWKDVQRELIIFWKKTPTCMLYQMCWREIIMRIWHNQWKISVWTFMYTELTSLVSTSRSRWLTPISNDEVLCLCPCLGFCISSWMAYPSKNQFLSLSCICDCLCKCLLHLSYLWSDHISSSLWSMVEKDKSHLKYSKVLRRLRKP